MAFQDVRFAFRLLRRNPALSMCAILAEGLGIGATSAIFSVTDSVLLRPLALPHSERLVNVWETMPKRHEPRFPVAAANYFDWRAQAKSFSDIGAYFDAAFGLDVDGGEPERYTGAASDRGFFAALGVTPLRGRIFAEDEDRPGRNRVVLLSYDLWQNRFGGDRHILGRTLNINSIPRVVIGVMPAGFDYPNVSAMWVPMALDAVARARRDLHTLRVIARLKPGVSVNKAHAEMTGIAAQLAQRYPDLDGDESALVNGILDDLTFQIRPTLLLLLAGAAFVLLIACANVATLLLARASGRQREIAVRVSLGAGRAAVLRQMMIESLALAVAAGCVGLSLAEAAFHALLTTAPESVPRLQEIGLNWRAVGITLLVTLVTGVLLGLAPAVYAARVDIQTLLKEGARGTTRRSGLRGLLVTVQVAAASSDGCRFIYSSSCCVGFDARGDRNLRRHFLFRDGAHRGDRNPHGLGRGGIRGPLGGHATGYGLGLVRAGDRLGRVPPARPVDGRIAVPRGCARSLGARGVDGRDRPRRVRGIFSAGAPGGPARSAGRAANRLSRFRNHTANIVRQALDPSDGSCGRCCHRDARGFFGQRFHSRCRRSVSPGEFTKLPHQIGKPIGLRRKVANARRNPLRDLGPRRPSFDRMFQFRRDLGSRAGATRRHAPDLIGHNAKSQARLAGMGRFNRSVKREQIRPEGDLVEGSGRLRRVACGRFDLRRGL